MEAPQLPEEKESAADQGRPEKGQPAREGYRERPD